VNQSRARHQEIAVATLKAFETEVDIVQRNGQILREAPNFIKNAGTDG
jgi:hypothetical protein